MCRPTSVDCKASFMRIHRICSHVSFCGSVQQLCDVQHTVYTLTRGKVACFVPAVRLTAPIRRNISRSVLNVSLQFIQFCFIGKGVLATSIPHCRLFDLWFNVSLSRKTTRMRYTVYSKASSSAGLSNADSIIRVKINENYLPNAENLVIRGLPNTL
jgi:hypothetical protein